MKRAICNYTSVILAFAHEATTEFHTGSFARFTLDRSTEAQNAFESQRPDPYVVADLKPPPGPTDAPTVNVRLPASKTRRCGVVLGSGNSAIHGTDSRDGGHDR